VGNNGLLLLLRMMKKIIDVGTGGVVVCCRAVVLRAMAIGSCIVIAFYDSETKVAGMAHIMLPDHAPRQSSEKTKYAADAIGQTLTLMLESGSNPDDIEVCLVGAGNVLQKKDDTICADNIKSVTAILAQKSIPIKASVLGGYKRKSIFLDVETGGVSYTEGDDRKKPLWQRQEAAAVKQSLKGE